MKKLQTLVILPIIALNSCSTDTQKPVDTQTQTNSGVETSAQSENGTQDLNKNISSSTTTASGTEIKNFNESYDLPNGTKGSIKGSIEITNGKVSNITFEGVNLENPKYPAEIFAKAITPKILGQEISTFKVDAVSGASLTSAAFDKYLQTINNSKKSN